MLEQEIEKMISQQIIARNVNDEKVLKAMANVPRHLFVPEEMRLRAYVDGPLPIGYGQTISQPYIVAFMTAALKLTGEEKILEIGTGSGYQTAILAEIVKEVYTIEIIKELYEQSESVFKKQGYKNIKSRFGDGYNGWPEEAPFDGIIITAAPHKMPDKLLDQIKPEKHMIVPVGDGWHQELKCITKTKKGIKTSFLLDVRFVPMTGDIERDR